MGSPNIRALAARTLAPVLQQKASLSSTFDENRNKIDEKERGLFQELCFGVLRNYYQLKAIADALLEKPLRNKDSDVLALILIGFYQLRNMRIPDHAAISETVSGSKPLKKPWAKGLVNGILREYQRNSEAIATSTKQELELEYNHPQWFIGKLKKAWPDQWQTTLEANNQQPPIFIRLNTFRCSIDDYLKQLKAQGIEAKLSKHSPTGIQLETAAEISSLPGYQQGVFCVQDEAAQLSGQLLKLEDGNRILDACCAPGGKTTHILESSAALEKVTAIELEAKRLEKVSENIERLRLDKHPLELKCADASNLDSWWDNIQFDRILLDAPCSATGVIRRHPDIKLLRRPDDLAKLAELQTELLNSLWKTLKPGGVILYATCSVLPQENEKIVEEFLLHNNDAKELPFNDCSWGIQRPVGRQLFPQVNGHDGFYYARIIKES